MPVTKKASGDVVSSAMQHYGSYVLEERALADLRDGLKPVQRRLLWAAWERLGLRPGSTPKKSARVIGETCGLFHPHGEGSVQHTMVGMTWANYPFLEGKGNFGDPPAKKPAAAARYTSVKATPLLVEVFKDKPVTRLVSNYSAEVMEPAFLPSRVPTLLLNGSEGIAVGVASNIPPHNLEELVKAALLVLKNPNVRLSTLLKHVKGPDYSDGGRLVSTPDQVMDLYATGSGSLEFRCLYRIKEEAKGWSLTVGSAAPYWRIPRFLDRCNKLVSDNRLSWVANESGQHLKIVVFARTRELLQNVIPFLTVKVRYNWIALEDGKPVKLNLKTYLTKWLDFRRTATHLHLQYKLHKLAQRLKEEEAKLAAVQNLDATIAAIRNPKPATALRRALSLDTEQAKVILRSSIRLLTRLGERKQLETVKSLKQTNAELRRQLQDIDGTVATQLKELMQYKKDRQTKVKRG